MSPRLTWSLAPLGVLAVVGCRYEVAAIPPIPTPRSISSNKDMNGLHFTFDKWDQGLTVMFVDNVHGGTDRNGKMDGSTYSKRTSVRRAGGVGYDWVLTTADGKSAELIINEVPYDLRAGALFVVQTDGQNVVVHQLSHDLSMLNYDLAECTSFVNNNREIIELLNPGAIEN